MGGWKTKNWHDNREPLANPCHLCWAVGWFVSWPFKLFHTYLQVVKNRVLLRPPFSSHKLHQTDLHTAAKTARDWFESLFVFFLFWQGVGPAGVPCFFFFGGACFTYQWFISSSADWLQDSWPTSMENLHEFFLFGSLVVSDIGSGAWCLLPITSELCTQIHLRDLPAHPSRGVTCVFFWNCSFFWWQHSPEKKGGQTEQTKKQERNKAKPNQTKSNKQQKNKQTKPTNQTTKQTQFFCLFGGRHFVLQPLQQSDSLVFLGFGFGWKTGGWRAQAAKGYVVLP